MKLASSGRFLRALLIASLGLSGCGRDITQPTPLPPCAAPAATDDAGATPDASTTTPDASTTTPDASTTTPDTSTTTPDASTATPDATTALDPTACLTCPVEEAAPPSEGGDHVAVCGPTAYASNPPASGGHYGFVPVFRSYDRPVPWGFLVHALEHGAVVIAYNCPEGCAPEVAMAKALIESLPRKPDCPRPRPPVILTPDPTLTVRFAAAAWGKVLRAPCFNRAAFTRFIEVNANHAPEFFPSDCGSYDEEASGWCK